MFFNFSSSSLRQWFATLCCSFGSGLTASSVMAYNSILVESLQKDPDTNFTFEETSWFCKISDSRFHWNITIISASCWAFTAILGCFVGGIISDMAGRRMVIIISVVPFIMGSIMVKTNQSQQFYQWDHGTVLGRQHLQPRPHPSQPVPGGAGRRNAVSKRPRCRDII